jgi:ribosomal protein L24E
LENALLDLRDSLTQEIFRRIEAPAHNKETVFWFGQYKDITVATVLKANPRYVKWCIDHKILRFDAELEREAIDLYKASFKKKPKSNKG